MKIESLKSFLRYVDDIVKKMKGDPEERLRAANKLDPKMQLTIRTPSTSGKLEISDLQTNTEKNKSGEGMESKTSRFRYQSKF